MLWSMVSGWSLLLVSVAERWHCQSLAGGRKIRLAASDQFRAGSAHSRTCELLPADFQPGWEDNFRGGVAVFRRTAPLRCPTKRVPAILGRPVGRSPGFYARRPVGHVRRLSGRDAVAGASGWRRATP